MSAASTSALNNHWGCDGAYAESSMPLSKPLRSCIAPPKPAAPAVSLRYPTAAAALVALSDLFAGIIDRILDDPSNLPFKNKVEHEV